MLNCRWAAGGSIAHTYPKIDSDTEASSHFHCLRVSFFLLISLLSVHFQLIGNTSNKLCRWVDTFWLLNGRNYKITLLAFLNSWTPGSTLEHWWGSLWKSLNQKILQYISLFLHATPLLFFSVCGPLWVTRLWTTTACQPSCLVGGKMAQGCTFWDVSMCVQKRRWVWKGVDLLLSQGKFQVANSWHACAAGSVTKAMQPPPFCPVRATPLIVSDRGNWFQLTPIQQPFDWQTKDTATWRLMLGLSSLEVVQSPPAFSLPLPWADHTLAWSRFALVRIKQETTKEWVSKILSRESDTSQSTCSFAACDFF